MANTVEDYLNFVTSQYAKQPNFNAVISIHAAVSVQLQQMLESMIPIFDLDTPPVGQQLDIIGQWVGVSRNVEIPISGIFFTWDGSSELGWDQGIWQGDTNSDSITTLPDSNYLVLIKARIAANSWDGTTEGAYKIFKILFPNFTLLIQDNQNMSFNVIVQGALLDALTIALLTGGYLPLKPEGVRISSYVLPVNTGPLFGWDLENSYFQGWDVGSWGMEIAPT